ncbi:MAG: hypothetical protein K8M05_36580, partial [Deltaproteobacteria bacterium]|nr:hypothetical protein [Kofleriaceae bacterium]
VSDEAASAKGPARPAASSLTSGDRFTMRLALVALVALGPLLFFRFGQTWRAVRDHATWFVPEPPPAPRTFKGDPRVLDQVPSDAEVVFWLRNFDGLGLGEGSKDRARKPDQPDEVLIAFRDGELLVVIRGPEQALADVDLDEANRQLPKQDWLPIRGKLVKRSRGKDLLVVVTEGWAQSADDRHAGKSTGPTAIIERLSGAPADAVIISAASPSRPIASFAVNGAQSWLRVSTTEIRLDGEVFVSDQAVATAIAAGLRAAQKDLEGRVPGDCKPPVARLLSRFVIDSGETSVRVSARWSPDEIGEAMMCALAAAMKNADWKAAK